MINRNNWVTILVDKEKTMSLNKVLNWILVLSQFGSLAQATCDLQRTTDLVFFYRYLEIPDGVDSIEFEVKASNDVHIALSPFESKTHGSYEIVFGAGRNTFSALRRCNPHCEDKYAVYTYYIVSPSVFRKFWITFGSNKGIAVGWGNETTPFLEWIDPNPLIVQYVGYSTGFGSTGEFRFCNFDDTDVAFNGTSPNTISSQEVNLLTTMSSQQVRLSGGNETAGRVEVFLNGEWGTVCDDNWDILDATVVCRQLGFLAGLDALTRFDGGQGLIHLDEVSCTGNESTLQDCPRNTHGHDCSHSEDVGIACSRVRLANGTTTAAGRIEIYLNGQWGTVCDHSWDLHDAAVVCRQLGFKAAIEAFGNARFGEGTGPIHVDDVECTGNEISLLDCYFTSDHNCYHREDAGVNCLSYDNYSVRLAGGNTTAGRVEIYLNGQWGTVCDDQWDLPNAAVVCRQLGFKTASQALGYARFGEGTGPIHFDDVECAGNETSLLGCSFTSEHNCYHSEDAGVNCLPYVRLAGGSTTAGRVEVFLNGQWGTVCDDFWDLFDAAVVCRQLGFKTASLAISDALLGEGTGPIHIDDVRCTGNEISLLDCYSTSEHDCHHSEDAGVMCVSYANGDVRLHDNPGMVQIFFAGEWYNICSSAMNFPAANIVCRQLGFEAALDIYGNTRFSETDSGESYSTYMFNNPSSSLCGGYESTLDECLYSAWSDIINCGEVPGAYIQCLNRDHATPLANLSGSSSSSVTQQTASCSSVGKVRLSDGNYSAGRVEICLDEKWGTVCDDEWGLEDAEVVCRELGFKKASAALPEASFGEGRGPVHLDDTKCLGNETSLFSCNHSRKPNCQHKEDASVTCVPFVKGEIRLAGGNASGGRVEVYFDGQWGTVCDDDWDIDDASVVCRNIGFKGALYALKNAAFGEGEGLIHIDAVKCTGDEHSLLACEYKRDSDCRHHEDASVVCLTSEDEDLTSLSEGTSHEETTDTSLVIPVLSVCLIAILICAIVATTVHYVSRRERKRQEKLRIGKDVSVFGPLPDPPTADGPFVDMVKLESAENPQQESTTITWASKRPTGSRSSETNIYMSVIEDNRDSEFYEAPISKEFENKDTT